MRRYTGLGWIRCVLGSTEHCAAFRRAGQLVGQALLASAAAEIRGFSFYFDKLSRGPAKLPQVNTYGISGMLRALCVVRADMGVPAWAITEEDWEQHLREMTRDTTAIIWREVQVRALADAVVMVATIKSACSKFMGYRKAAQWRRLDVLDLSCQSCEFAQVLRAVKTRVLRYPRSRRPRRGCWNICHPTRKGFAR